MSLLVVSYLHHEHRSARTTPDALPRRRGSGDRLQRDAGRGGRGHECAVDAPRPRQDQVERQAVEGEGTRFTLQIPATLPTSAPEPETSAAAGGNGIITLDGAEGDVVLVIDDEAAQRDLTTRFLQQQGFLVQTAVDGRSGLEFARTLLPKVILLDVMMPGMNGWSVLNALRQINALWIPFVMVSFVADANLDYAQRWVQLEPCRSRSTGAGSRQ